MNLLAISIGYNKCISLVARPGYTSGAFITLLSARQRADGRGAASAASQRCPGHQRGAGIPPKRFQRPLPEQSWPRRLRCLQAF